MPRVYNKRHHNVPKDAVYIGRPSRWGNPFQIGIDGTREAVIQKYEDWLIEKYHHDPDWVYRLVHPLQGKDLVCWCAPAPCHGDLLLKLANGTGESITWPRDLYESDAETS